MKKLLLLGVAVGIAVNAVAQSITITGPSIVCPTQEYEYTIDADFILAQCSAPVWSVLDENGALVKSGGGHKLTIAFDHPQNKTYTIRAFASGGIGCFTTVSALKTVTTKYPLPTITGPKYICPGGSGILTAMVDPSYVCFHHKLQYLLPPGWVATTIGNGKTSIAVPSTAENKSHTIKARVWYDDLNLYGDYVDWKVWVGVPGYTGSTMVSDVNSNSRYVYTYSNSVGFYVASGPALTYKWTITADQSCGSTYRGPKFYSDGNGTQATTTTNSINVNTGTCAGTFRISCYAVNGCGTTYYSQRLFRVSSSTGGGGCEPTLTVYPNPSKSTNTLSITLLLPSPDCNNNIALIDSEAKATVADVISSITVADSFGHPVREERIKSTSHAINTSNLSPGFYHLTVRTEQGRSYSVRISVN